MFHRQRPYISWLLLFSLFISFFFISPPPPNPVNSILTIFCPIVVLVFPTQTCTHTQPSPTTLDHLNIYITAITASIAVFLIFAQLDFSILLVSTKM